MGHAGAYSNSGGHSPPPELLTPQARGKLRQVTFFGKVPDAAGSKATL